MDVTSRVQDSTHTSSITGQNSLSLNGDYQQQNYNLNSSIPSETNTNGLNGAQEESREESKSPTKEELDAAALLGFVGAVVVEGTQVTTVTQNGYASSNGNSLESETPKLLPPISHATAMEIAHSIPLEALPSPSEAAPPAPLNTFPTEPPSIPTPVQITSTTSPSLPIPSEIPPPPQRMEYTSSERVEPLAPAPVPISQPSYSPAPTQPYASAPAPSYTPPIQPTPVAAPISAPAPYAFDTSLETNSAYNQVVESRMDLTNGESPVNKRLNEAMNGEEQDREIKRQKTEPVEAYVQPPQSYSSQPPPAVPIPGPSSHYSAPTYDHYSQPPPQQVIAPTALVQQPQYQQPPQPYIPPPPPPPPTEVPLAVFTKDQHKFCMNLLKTLKKNRSAPPFLRPVDPIALNIPDYFRVILYPTDLGTIENKLNATGRVIAIAAKNGRTFGIDYIGNGYWEGRGDGIYRTAEEFKEEINRVWENCFRYNGAKEKNAVSAMAGAMQEVAVKAFYSMPHAPSVAYTPPVVQARSPDLYSNDRRGSQLMHGESRPKRETHAPSRDSAYTLEGDFIPNKSRGRVTGKGAQEQLKFCKEVIREMFKKGHESFAFVFYQPVDYITLNIPTYPDVVKYPMDLGTIRSKLDQGLYPIPPYPDFEADMRLIFSNCYIFNPPGTAVHDYGKQLEYIFDEKWSSRPTGEEDDDDVSDDENISGLQQQIYSLQAQIDHARREKGAERARKIAASRPPPPPKPLPPPPRAPRESKPKVPKQRKSSTSGTGGGGRKKKLKNLDSSDDDDGHGGGGGREEIVSFEMKRELAVKITSFEGEDLERAIDIIRMGRPDLLSDENKEIELDIDQLDQSTLLSLYRFVCPTPPGQKRRRSSNHHSNSNNSGAGPTKRKNLDENKESERIEMLEARLRDFEGNGQTDESRRGSGVNNTGTGGGGGDRASSDSSSEEGSESESEQSD